MSKKFRPIEVPPDESAEIVTSEPDPGVEAVSTAATRIAEISARLKELGDPTASGEKLRTAWHAARKAREDGLKALVKAENDAHAAFDDEWRNVSSPGLAERERLEAEKAVLLREMGAAV